MEADYRRRGKTWTFGAFEPATGQAWTHCYSKRDTASLLDFLSAVVAIWPDGEIIIILDNLSTHRTLNALLWALAHSHVRFLHQPTYASWLNLIDPWWKTLRSLALKGHCFRTVQEVTQAIAWATDYWNHHRHPYEWRKVF